MVNFANFAQSELSSGIDDSQTTFNVSNASSFPAAPFYLTVEEEYMRVTDVSTNTFTVVRGVDDSTAASHTSGTRCVLLLTRAGLLDRHAENYMYGTIGNRPSPVRNGQMYFCTDLPVVFVSSGSDWIPFGPIHYLRKPPTSGWSWISQANALIDITDMGLLMTSTSNTSTYAFYQRTLQNSTLFTVDFGFIDGIPSLSNCTFGCFLREDAGNYAAIRFWKSDARIYCSRTNSSFGSIVTLNSANTAQMDSLGLIQFYRMQHDGTNIRFYYSNDRTTWVEMAVTATDTIFGTSVNPNRVGFLMLHNNGNAIGPGVHLVHYEETDDS